MQKLTRIRICKGVLDLFDKGTHERCRVAILGELSCVMGCVVTLASLPVSRAVRRYRSGTGEGQRRCGGTA